MFGEGTLTQAQFENFSQGFLEKSKALNDDWQLVEFGQKCCYLEKRTLRSCVTSLDRQQNFDTQLGDSIEEEDDCSLAEKNTNSSPEAICKFVYHVVYSTSYGVPVLYFTASKPDGSLLSLEEVWANVPEIHRKRWEFEKWTFLTQQEHPILGRPFYQLHPCHTVDLMKKVLASRGDHTLLSPVNYIISWLSTVGPVVGLELSLRYCTDC